MTEREQKIYDFIKEYVTLHGYAPSYREIAEAVGLKSLSSVFEYIRRLSDAGLVESEEGECSPRAFRITGYVLQKDPVLSGLELVRDKYGDSKDFVVSGKIYSTEQMIKEVRNNSRIGKAFSSSVYENVLTYITKFSKGEK